MNAAISVLLVCGVITLLPDSSVGARKGDHIGLKPGKETCVAVTDNSSSVRLRCRPNDVIYSLAINTYNGSGCDVTACSGLQPQVLTDSLLCYSRRNCTIYFSNGAPIVKAERPFCIGASPSSLRLSYLCVRKDIFIALNRRDVVEGRDEVKLDQGMLVSHATYPWHYSPGLMLNMTIRSKTPDRRTLYVSVSVLDIDMTDEVKLTSQDGDHVLTYFKATTPAGRPEEFKTSSEPSLMLIFNTNRSSSTGKGFLLCFYWAKLDEDMSKADICSKVTPRKRKGRKRKKGGKCKGKCKSKNGKKRKRKGERKRKGKKRSKKKST